MRQLYDVFPTNALSEGHDTSRRKKEKEQRKIITR
jgi:hypothetical protein